MIRTRNTDIQTAELMEAFQNCMTVAAALISAGTEMAMVYPNKTGQPRQTLQTIL
jgi:hypothetical protein